MAVFIRPGRVVVEESGSGGLAAVAGLAALAVIISAASVIITDVLTVILITLTAAALAGLGVLAVILRRTGLAVTQTPAAVPHRDTAALTGTAQAISGPRPRRIIPGTVQPAIEDHPVLRHRDRDR